MNEGIGKGLLESKGGIIRQAVHKGYRDIAEHVVTEGVRAAFAGLLQRKQVPDLHQRGTCHLPWKVLAHLPGSKRPARGSHASAEHWQNPSRRDTYFIPTLPGSPHQHCLLKDCS